MIATFIPVVLILLDARFQLKSTSLYDCNFSERPDRERQAEMFQLKSTSLYDCNKAFRNKRGGLKRFS